MSTRYDALVVGSGAAGATAARALKTGGLSVALAEGGDFGGTCALRGCEPKKVLAETAHAVARVRDMAGRNGVRGEVAIDWPALAALKQKYVDAVPPRSESSLEMSGIDLYHGRARFTGPNSMDVDGESVEASHIVLATGSKPRPLDFPGCELLATSDDFLNLKELPQGVAFIGGGYIAMEFSHIAAIAGASVTMAVRGDRCVKRFEPELTTELCKATQGLGVDILYNSPPHSLERTATGYVLRTGLTGEQRTPADVVFHGAGRAADLDGLDLDKAGIAVKDGALVLDGSLRTSNPAVYAAGDAAGRYQLTPTATMEGAAVARSILTGAGVKPDYSLVPSCTFTHPPLAGVGLTEEQAKARGIPHEIRMKTGLTWPELTRLGVRHSGYKLVLEPGGGRILGMCYMGEDAEEVANAAALVMRMGLTKKEIMDILWAYPSFGYALRYMLS